MAHVNGYTQPSLNDLHKMIVSHGGGFLQYLDGKTMATHIIASNLTPKKAEEFKAYRIVKPAWVVDSIQAGKLLSWTSYRAVDKGIRQKILGFQDGKMFNQQSKMRQGYKEQTETSWYTTQNQLEPRVSAAKHDSQQYSSFSDLDDAILDHALPVVTPHSKRESSSTPLANLGGFRAETDDIQDDDLPDNMELGAFQSPEHHSDGDSSEGFPHSPFSLLMDREPLGNSKIMLLPPEEDQDSVVGNSPVQQKRSMADSESIGQPSKRPRLTTEEHNALLLANPNIRKSTVVNPAFLEQYYRESRLHHLSTWRADLKSKMQRLADAYTASQKNARKTRSTGRRYVFHVDFDCFFAAVSIKQFPEYNGLPAAVAHGSGSGSEIASCNYEARKFGVKNGMWMRRAHELCPELKVLPYDFLEYERSSRAFYEGIIALGGVVQSVSVDEALVDITNLCLEQARTDGTKSDENGVEREQEAADGLATQLRKDIKAATDCNVSVGIGGNILLAKLALRKAKPAGQYQLRPDEVLDFLEPLEVEKLPGFAHHMGAKLEQIGIKYVRDVRAASKERLINTLGPKTGEKLWEYARGIDRKEVGDVEVRKSVSAEVNWGVRFQNQEQVDEFIDSLCGELNRRLVKEKVRGKQLTLKVMKRSADAPLDPPKHLGHGLCDTFNKSLPLGVATNLKETLTKECLTMLKSFGFSPGELRGIGVQMTKLEPLKPRNENSQKLLQFKPIQPITANNTSDDPIEETTPKKPKAPAVSEKILFGAEQLNQLTPSRKLLNMRGTQFILPTQVDQQVLDELPKDIRSRLVAAERKAIKESLETPAKPGSTPKVFTALPSKSQIDPETFAALPPEMQSEIMSFYDSPINSIQLKAPNALKVDKNALAPTAAITVGMAGKGKSRTPKKVNTLTQSNFITSHFSRSNQEAQLEAGRATDSDTPPLSPTYLAALPSPLRAEVMAEHKQTVLRAKNRRLEAQKKLEEQEARKRRPARRKLELPALGDPRPTFTKAKLCTIQELRKALKEWVEEFGKDGPYQEDAEALGKYLGRVVKDEGDLSKAVEALKWLGWCVGEIDWDGEEKGKLAWQTTIEKLGTIVQGEVKGRGLGRVKS